jgi:hypothetical protein
VNTEPDLTNWPNWEYESGIMIPHDSDPWYTVISSGNRNIICKQIRIIKMGCNRVVHSSVPRIIVSRGGGHCILRIWLK